MRNFIKRLSFVCKYLGVWAEPVQEKDEVPSMMDSSKETKRKRKIDIRKPIK